MAEREVGDNLIPVRSWIRGHYTKLSRNTYEEAACNHCNTKFIISNYRLATLHKHLVEAHPDKLTEEEKKEVKFHWTWDYFTLNDDTTATCKICKRTFVGYNVTYLTGHLRIHNITGPSSDSVINTENASYSDANRDITPRKAEHQEGSSNSVNNLYECTEGARALNEEAADNVIPIRRWIRGHYTQLSRNNYEVVICNHCNTKFLISIYRLDMLHKHLVEAHPDKLTEEEKKEVKFCWTWDYFTLNDETTATCKICKRTFVGNNVTYLTRHLRIHNITGPSSDSVINTENASYSDANSDMTPRKAEHQEGSSNSVNNLYECTEGARALNEEAADNVIPIRRWIRGHYTQLSRNNYEVVICNHCNTKFLISIYRLDMLHKHLVEAHPDKLTEEEKKEVKFCWTWDYFTLNDETTATCKICKRTFVGNNVTYLTRHLRIHNITGPSSDSVINTENASYSDANSDMTPRKAEHQEGSSNSVNNL